MSLLECHDLSIMLLSVIIVCALVEQPSGPRGVAQVTSAEDVVLGNSSWDVTISSLSPRSVHDTFDTTDPTSRVNTPRVVPPRALLSRQVLYLETACLARLA